MLRQFLRFLDCQLFLLILIVRAKYSVLLHQVLHQFLHCLLYQQYLLIPIDQAKYLVLRRR